MMRMVPAAVAALAVLSMTINTVAADKLDRTVLPIAEPQPPIYMDLDVRNVKPPPRFEVKAPKDAPNVLVVLIDDLGFGERTVHYDVVVALRDLRRRARRIHGLGHFADLRRLCLEEV